MAIRRAAVLAANRIPFARQFGPYAEASNQELFTAALDGLVNRTGLAGEQVGEVVAGAVLKHSRDFNLTRESVLGSALAPTTPAYDLQQACATGLEATILVANKIALGQVDSGIAGGVDSASDPPLAVREPLRKTLLAATRAKGPAATARALSGLRPWHVGVESPATIEPRTGLSMGEHMALTAAAWGIERTAQDEVALASHRHLAAAYERGFFTDLMTAHRGLERDQFLRPDTSMAKLAALRPAFGTGEGATLTAGNSTPLTDGASTVLLGSAEWAAAHDLQPWAWFVDGQAAAVDYVDGREGMLMAPAYALPVLLERVGMSLGDFDRYEIHEAFAATVLTTLAAWADPTFCRERLGVAGALGTIDLARLNVNGSSLATGHPFAATGARIVGSLAKMLHELGPGSRGLISICAAGGQGVVAILEGA